MMEKETTTPRMEQKKDSSYYSTSVVFLASILVRVILFLTPFAEWLPWRIEITTSLTSWSKLKECISLTEYGISPYEGDICHQPPLVILFFSLMKNSRLWMINGFFIVCDLISGWLLMKAAEEYTKQQLEEQKENVNQPECESLLWKEDDSSLVPFLVAVTYLINPYTILSCVGLSTVVLNNLVMSFALFLLVRGNHYAAVSSLAVASYLSLYPVTLLAAFCVDRKPQGEEKGQYLTMKSLKTLTIFVLSMGVLLSFSYATFSSWDFSHATYLFILKAPDLTPNMGLFWYFFQEMFEHFRVFFIWVLQLHALVYVIPFSITFRNRPLFLCYILLSTISWCKSYPSLGDLSVPFALLPLWKNSYSYLRSQFVVLVAFVFSSIMAPVLYHLWVYAGSGNANFFYAATLAFNLAQVMLLTDVVYATLRRDFHLKHGLEPLAEDGTTGYVIMKQRSCFRPWRGSFISLSS